jgi:hypothetical protein
MEKVQIGASYRTYWIAWFVLLGLTIVMVFLATPVVLIAGMTVKAAIIGLIFMHLRYERLLFVLYILLGIFATALILYGLIAPDGKAM